MKPQDRNTLFPSALTESVMCEIIPGARFEFRPQTRQKKVIPGNLVVNDVLLDHLMPGIQRELHRRGIKFVNGLITDVVFRLADNQRIRN